MKELIRLPTRCLKEVQQKLTPALSPGLTRDGKLIPEDVPTAYRDGTVSDIEFIIGISSNERQVYKSIVGEKNTRILYPKSWTPSCVTLTITIPPKQNPSEVISTNR